MKKIISLILCLAILLISSSAVFAAYEKYDEVKGLLGALNVIDVSESDDKIVSRAELVAMCEKAFGLADVDITQKYEYPVYTDVSVEHIYYKEILLAYDMKCITPYSEGKFYPDAPATLDDVVVIVLNFLGCKDLPNYYQDDYLSVYYKIAKNQKLLDNVEINSGTATVKTVCRILYNALFCDFTYDLKNLKKPVSGENILNKVHHIKNGEGVLTSDKFFSVVRELADDNCVIIDGRQYYCGSANYHDYIGKSVCFYYKERPDSRCDEIVYICESNNEVIDLKGEDVEYSSGKIVDISSKRGKTYAIDAKTSVVFNNRLIDSSEYEEAFSYPNSRIRLIDNSKDKKYDVVIIEAAKIIQVDTYNPSTDILTSLQGDAYDLSKYKSVLIESYYGDVIYNRGAINSGMIVSVIDPLDENCAITFKICDKSVVAGIDIVNIDKSEVILDNGVRNKVSAASIYPVSKIVPGNTYTLYYNSYDEIVFAKLEGSTEYKVGFVADLSRRQSLSSILQLKIYCPEDSMAIYDVALNAKYRDKYGDTHKATGHDEIIKVLSESGSYRQPIAYRLNSKKEICEILTLAVPERDDLVFHEIDWLAESSAENKTMKFNKNDNSFGSRMQFTASTKFFVVPNDKFPNIEDSDYMKMGIAYNFLRIGASYTISKDDYYPYAISMEENGFLVDYFYFSYPYDGQKMNRMPAYSIGMVVSTKQAVNENDGGIDLVVTILGNTGQLTDVVYRASDGSHELKDFNGQTVSVGDLILSNRDYDGSLSNTTMQLYYRASDGKFFREAAGSFDYYSAYRIARMIIGEKQNGYCKCTCIRSDGTRSPEVLNFTAAKVFTYDMNKQEAILEGSAMNNVSEDEEVIMILSGGSPTVVIKYK